MNRPVFLTLPSALQTTMRPINLATLRLIERASLRPKTAIIPIVAFAGMGLFYSLNMLPIGDKERSRRKREPVLWDFFDPQGHHQIVE